MKKTKIVFAVLSLAALASCQNNELRDDQYIPEEGEIVFRLSNASYETKGSDANFVTSGVSIPVGPEEMGLTLNETIVQLDRVPFTPETKGVPGYSENFNAVYNGFDATVWRTGDSDPFEEDGRFELVNESSRIYKRLYSNDLWDKGGLYFFLNAYYKEGSMAGVSDLKTHPVAEEATADTPAYKAGDISFHYSAANLKTAAEQSDLLFTSRAVTSEEEYKILTSKDQGIPVLFHHALTGVKFRSNSSNEGSTKTIITKVVISGLYNSGDCVISPETENGGYVDIKNNYSSARAVKWTVGTNTSSFEQEFANPTYVVDKDNPENNRKNPDGTVTFTKTNSNFGDSWYDAANDKNLNSQDGSLTFWFIPQIVPDNVELKVTFRVKTPDTPDGTEITHTISNFGAKIKGTGTKNVEWKAGELRTYTLDPKDVDVEIFDTMSGMKKEGLHVTNTGNVDEYVRMLIVGNWYGWLSQESKDNGDEPSILIGYTSDGSDGKNDMVPYWDYRDTKKTDGSFFDNTFKYGVPANGNKWIRGTGAYYYPEPIGAGKSLPSGTDALFQSYEYTGTVPDIYIPSITSNIRTKAVGVHLVMEVVVQAIPTTKADGSSYSSIWEAWSTTTGTTITQKNSQ